MNNEEFHQNLLCKYGRLMSVRPMQLGEILIRLLCPADERRRFVSTKIGLRLYVDPLTNLGAIITNSGIYEAETTSIFQEELKEGDVIWDIGANEGYFSALASTLVGDNGWVIAVEPQSRLCDLIEINLRANNAKQFHVFKNAFGNESEKNARINLYPSLNSGASSIVRKHRFSERTEEVSFVSPKTILEACPRTHVDFIKVDVEGFENVVVRELLPYIKSGKIKKLLLDYHLSILESQQIDPVTIHDSILSAGMKVKRGDSRNLNSYVLYELG